MELKQAYQSRVTTHSRNALAPSYLNTVPFFTNFLLLNSDVNLQSVLLGRGHSPTGSSTSTLRRRGPDAYVCLIILVSLCILWLFLVVSSPTPKRACR